MHRNRNGFILVLFLGLISLWFILHNRKSTLRKGLRNFAIEDTASITKIFLADRNDHTITLEKQKPGSWRLNSKFFARNDAINILLATLKTIEVKSPVGKNAQENTLKSLAAQGIKFEAYQGDKLVKLFYVGSETQDMLGTFMLLADPETRENSIVPYVTYIPGFDGFLTTRFFTSETEWRDRTIFHYSPSEIKTIHVEFPAKKTDDFELHCLPGNRFELISLADGQPVKHIDTAAVMQYISYFHDIQFELFEKLSSRYRDSVIASQPMSIVSVTDTKGNENAIKIFYKTRGSNSIGKDGKPAKYDQDRIFALINSGKDFVTIQYYVFGKILQPVAYFSPKDIVKR